MYERQPTQRPACLLTLPMFVFLSSLLPTMLQVLAKSFGRVSEAEQWVEHEAHMLQESQKQARHRIV